jgi:C-terminal peptidase prc
VEPVKFSRKILFQIAILLLLTLSCQSVGLGQTGVLEEVRTLLRSQYVDEIPESVLAAPSIQEILDGLGDPYTSYFSRDEYLSYIDALDHPAFSGIGIVIEALEEGVLVLSVFPGSPAEEAGLEPGDLILQADGIMLAGMSTEEAAHIIRGPQGSVVELLVARGSFVFQVRAERREIIIDSVYGEVINGHVGYIEINSFALDTAVDFGNMVSELKGKNVDSWIIDLRYNSGGYLSSALEIAGFFIGDGKAMEITNRDGTGSLFAVKPDELLDMPVIMLVNGFSASASEIVAAVAKDYGKALLVGETTFGKGTVQTLFDLADGSVLKMTIYRFLSALGNPIDRFGVDPDIYMLYADPQLVADMLLSESRVKRVAGVNRLRTAVEVSKRGWSEGASAVVVARADEFADALSGTVLAAKYGAPMLLTYSDGLGQDVKDELARLQPRDVIILGGTAAVSAAVENELKALYGVRRIAGMDRFETAALIAAEVGQSGEAILVNGFGFADALSVSAYAGSRGIPILLTRGDSVPDATLQALNQLGTEKVTVVGGPAAVSLAVEQGLPYQVDRIAGADRYQTSVEVAKRANSDKLFVVRGDGFADALAGGAWAAREGGTVVLVGTYEVPESVGVYVLQNAPAISGIFVIGGYAAVSADVQGSLLSILYIRP